MCGGRASFGHTEAGPLLASCFAKIGLSSGVVRIEVEVVVARIGGVRHVSRTFGLHMGVGVMLRADRVAKITRSHSVSSFPTSQSLIALPN